MLISVKTLLAQKFSFDMFYLIHCIKNKSFLWFNRCFFNYTENLLCNENVLRTNRLSRGCTFSLLLSDVSIFFKTILIL